MRGTVPSLSHTSSGRGAQLSTGHVFMVWYLVIHWGFAFLSLLISAVQIYLFDGLPRTWIITLKVKYPCT